MEKIELRIEEREEIPISDKSNYKEENISLLNIDNVKIFSKNVKILDLKKRFKRTLYDKRIRYGRLCNLGIVNQNLRLNKLLNFEEIKSDKSFNEIEDSNETKTNNKDLTDIPKLKINLKGNFRDEIEKIFYDPEFNINIRPDTRELNLLQMLKQKINKLNSLD